MTIVKSLLDTDLYKFLMHQIFFHQFPYAHAKYRFKNRTEEVNLLKYKDEIQSEVNKLNGMKFTKDDLDYLSNIKDHIGNPLFKESYINYLNDFTFKTNYVNIQEINNKLDISLTGNILQTMLFEIYILKIVHEVYSHNEHTNPDYIEGMKRLNIKIDKIKDYLGLTDNFDSDIEFDMKCDRYFHFADFGTRRAFSSDWQDNIVKMLSRSLPDNFIGTSNVYLAKKYNIKPIGTFAHEFVEAFQGLGICQLKDSQKVAFQSWVDEYRGSLGICLSDTLGVDKFLKDFDLYFSKLFDGVRHDSGCPFIFTDKMVEHYKKLGIDPNTKTIVFSDGLDIDLALKLANYCKSKIKCSFGIGTNLTNDLGYKSLQIVMKMIECGDSSTNMNPVAKVSDNPAKTMCEDENFLQYILSVIN